MLCMLHAGRIGTAYARMMMEGHKMNVVYFDPFAQNKFLEQYGSTYNKVLDWAQEPRISVKRLNTVEEVLQQADVSIQTPVVYVWVCPVHVHP